MSDTAALRNPRGPGLLNHVHLGHSSLGLKYNPVNEFTLPGTGQEIQHGNLCAEYFQNCIMSSSYKKVSVLFCLLKRDAHF